MSREDALREFIRRQLRPLMGRDELSRHMRIFNWETVQPTPVFRKLLSEEAAPFMDLRRRPGAPLPARSRPAHARGRGYLADRPVQRFHPQPRAARGAPIGLALDESLVEWLAQAISRWVIGGLGQPAGPRQPPVKPGDRRKNSFFRARRRLRTRV